MEEFLKQEIVIKEEPCSDEYLDNTLTNIDLNLKRSAVKAELEDEYEIKSDHKKLKFSELNEFKYEPIKEENEMRSSSDFNPENVGIQPSTETTRQILTSIDSDCQFGKCWMTAIPIKTFRDYNFQSFVYDQLLHHLHPHLHNMESMQLVRDVTAKTSHAIFAKFKNPVSKSMMERSIFPVFNDVLAWKNQSSESPPCDTWTTLLDIKLKYQKIMSNLTNMPGEQKKLQLLNSTKTSKDEGKCDLTYELCLSSELLVAEGRIPKQNLSRNDIFTSVFFQPPEEDKSFVGLLPPHVRVDRNIFNLKTAFQSKSIMWHLKEMLSFSLESGHQGVFLKFSDPLNFLDKSNLDFTFNSKFNIYWAEWNKDPEIFPKINLKSISSIKTELSGFFKLFAENSLGVEGKHWVGIFLKGLEKHVDDSYNSNSSSLRSKIASYQIYCMDDHRSIIELEFRRSNNVKKLNNLFFAIGALKWFPVGIQVMRKIRKLMSKWPRD